jgi:hypothetical protein
MRSINIRLTLLIVSTLFLARCNKDEVAQVFTGKPRIQLVNSSIKTIKPSVPFVIQVGGTRGENILKGLTFYENDLVIDISRIKINAKLLEGNPYLFETSQKENFSFRLDIDAPSIRGIYNYRIVVTDSKGDTAQVLRSLDIDSDPPRLTYVGQSPIVSPINSSKAYKINTVKGTGQLKSLRVLQNDILIAPNRIKFGNLNPTTNPFNLEVIDLNGFDKDITITSPIAAGEYTYTFIVEDEFGATSAAKVNIIAGTPLVELVSKNLYNFNRNATSGGLTLETGVESSRVGTNISFVDEGIDSTKMSLPWKRQIRPVNGTEMKYIRIGQNGVVQTFSYRFVETQESVKILFDQGVAFTLKNAQNQLVSDPLQIGNILVAKQNNKYYLIETDNVFNTDLSNDDFYKLNIKK